LGIWKESKFRNTHLDFSTLSLGSRERMRMDDGREMRKSVLLNLKEEPGDLSTPTTEHNTKNTSSLLLFQKFLFVTF